MKVFLVAVVALTATCTRFACPAMGANIFVDFGRHDGTNGNATVGADVNGNYWNSLSPPTVGGISAPVANGTIFLNLITTSNTTTSIGLKITSVNWAANGLLNGGLFSPYGPSNSLLGDLAIETATQDYFFFNGTNGATGTFTLTGLDARKTYNLRFFGTRSNEAERATTYSVGTNSVDLLTSGPASGISATNRNDHTIVNLNGIVPDANSEIPVTVTIKSGSTFAYLGILAIEVVEPPPALETVLVDFGRDGIFRSVSVSNPDQNGNYWNSIGALQTNLLNSTNGASGINIQFNTSFAPDSYNGPAGVVINDPPSAAEIAGTAIDTVALGLLGITNAVMDYFAGTNQQFTLTNLNPAWKYRLIFFGSHKFSTDEATVYSVYTDNAYTSMVASVSLNVQVPGSPNLHNSNNVAVLSNLSPQSGNAIYVKFDGGNGGDGYLNAMMIEAFVPASAGGGVNMAKIAATGGTISVSFVGSNTVSYTMQYTTNLLDGSSWLPVLNGGNPVTVTGDGVNEVLLTDPAPTNTSRAYRLFQAP